MKTPQDFLNTALNELALVSDYSSLDTIRVSYLGKKGHITLLLKELGALPPEQRKAYGQVVNDAKQQLTVAIEEKHALLEGVVLNQRLLREKIDVTLPGRHRVAGSVHPITKTRLRIETFFKGLGFDVERGPDIETEYYNFDALNMPQNHPARAMQDTFYFEDGHLLRTHTSSVQIHYMETHKPPYRMIALGRVYRCDSDVTHTPMFHQVEGLVIDKNLTMAHLKTLLQDFMRAFFEFDCQIRFRSSYFPFTEPSAEVDVSCVACKGQKTGCRICKETGWLEVLGCGMVHPNVLKAGGIDPEEYHGFAFGMGLERLTMLRYELKDLRQFFENDIRFLKQFTGV
jgi:phenylalanyl-tRNA synthetase alpha chain